MDLVFWKNRGINPNLIGDDINTRKFMDISSSSEILPRLKEEEKQ